MLDPSRTYSAIGQKWQFHAFFVQRRNLIHFCLSATSMLLRNRVRATALRHLPSTGRIVASRSFSVSASRYARPPQYPGGFGPPGSGGGGGFPMYVVNASSPFSPLTQLALEETSLTKNQRNLEIPCVNIRLIFVRLQKIPNWITSLVEMRKSRGLSKSCREGQRRILCCLVKQERMSSSLSIDCRRILMLNY